MRTLSCFLLFFLQFLSPLYATFLVLSFPYPYADAFDYFLQLHTELTPHHASPQEVVTAWKEGRNLAEECLQNNQYLHVQGCYDEGFKHYLSETRTATLFFWRDPRDLGIDLLRLFDQGKPIHYFGHQEKIRPPDIWNEVSRSVKLSMVLFQALPRLLFRQEDYLKLPNVHIVRLKQLLKHPQHPLQLLADLDVSLPSNRQVHARFFSYIKGQIRGRVFSPYGQWKRHFSRYHITTFHLGFGNLLEELLHAP